jgi:hypothetical protein
MVTKLKIRNSSSFKRFGQKVTQTWLIYLYQECQPVLENKVIVIKNGCETYGYSKKQLAKLSKLKKSLVVNLQLIFQILFRFGISGKTIHILSYFENFNCFLFSPKVCLFLPFFAFVIKLKP